MIQLRLAFVVQSDLWEEEVGLGQRSWHGTRAETWRQMFTVERRASIHIPHHRLQQYRLRLSFIKSQITLEEPMGWIICIACIGEICRFKVMRRFKFAFFPVERLIYNSGYMFIIPASMQFSNDALWEMGSIYLSMITRAYRSVDILKKNALR